MKALKAYYFVELAVHTDRLARSLEEERRFNREILATEHPINLWLEERRMKAPFCKLVVDLLDERCGLTLGHVGVGHTSIGVVLESTQYPDLCENAGNPRWVVDKILSALRRIDEKAGWRSPEFEAVLEEFAKKPWPIVHSFNKLQRTDRRSGLTCTPWMSFRPGFTQIGVRISGPGKLDRDVEMFSKNGPIYEFALGKSQIQSGHFLLLDKDGNTLATVPLDPSSLH